MANEREKIEIENVHNHIYHAVTKRLFHFF
jgi:hypothetical protein